MGSTTSTVTHAAFIEVPTTSLTTLDAATYHPVEVLAHRETDCGREAKVKHLAPIPAGARRVCWADAEDIVLELVTG